MLGEVILGSLSELKLGLTLLIPYHITPNPAYLNLAVTLISCRISNLTSPGNIVLKEMERRIEEAGTLLKSNPGSKMIPMVMTTPFKVYFTDIISFKLVLHRPSGIENAGMESNS